MTQPQLASGTQASDTPSSANHEKTTPLLEPRELDPALLTLEELAYWKRQQVKSIKALKRMFPQGASIDPNGI